MKDFDIILVPFPFTSLRTSKQRPCLILKEIKNERLPDLYIVSMITSKTDVIKLRHDITIENWQQANLLKKSIVRLAKVVTIENTIINRKLGELDINDLDRVKSELKIMFC